MKMIEIAAAVLREHEGKESVLRGDQAYWPWGGLRLGFVVLRGQQTPRIVASQGLTIEADLRSASARSEAYYR